MFGPWDGLDKKPAASSGATPQMPHNVGNQDFSHLPAYAVNQPIVQLPYAQLPSEQQQAPEPYLQQQQQAQWPNQPHNFLQQLYAQQQSGVQQQAPTPMQEHHHQHGYLQPQQEQQQTQWPHQLQDAAMPLFQQLNGTPNAGMSSSHMNQVEQPQLLQHVAISNDKDTSQAYEQQLRSSAIHDQHESQQPGIVNNSIRTMTRRSSTTSSNGQDEFTDTIERILAAQDSREEEANLGSSNNSSSMGPLTQAEISKLSMLCTLQSSRRRSLSGDLGFADVDPELVAELVTLLGKHVNLASNVDLITAAYQAIQQSQARGSRANVEQWLEGPGDDLLLKLQIGLESAGILLFIMASPGIDRRVMTEDAIEATITLLRHHLITNILPSLNRTGHFAGETNKDEAKTPPSSKKRRRSGSSGGVASTVIREMRKVYSGILKTVGSLVVVMERLEGLVQMLPIDDQQIFILSAGAILTLELDPPSDSNFRMALKMAHQLHVGSIGIITAIFRKYPQHRLSIMEDLFPMMLKMPSSRKTLRMYPIEFSSVLSPPGLFRRTNSLATLEGYDGSQYIQTMTAVVIFLIQSCVMRPTHEYVQQGEEEGMGRLASGLRECQATCDSFVVQLLQRCSKKGEDGGASEFRPILSNLIDDFLLLLLVPEFPAAETILISLANLLSQDLMKAASSSKALQEAESTYLNTAFDALGKICAAEARILAAHRENPFRMGLSINPPDSDEVDCYCKKNDLADCLMLDCDRCHRWSHGDCVGIRRETVPKVWHCDSCQLARIVDYERDKNSNMGTLGCPVELINETYCMRRLLIDYLSILARDTVSPSVKDAYEFHLSRWIAQLDHTVDEAPSSRYTSPKISREIVIPLIVRLLEMWNPAESCDVASKGSLSLNGMLHCISDEGRTRMVIHLAATQSSLLKLFRQKVQLIVKLMASETGSALRKLAVKAIEKVADADPKLMLINFIKNAVVERFSDESISVRDAALTLVGSYVVHTPAVANTYHRAFLRALNDAGVSVKKRTVKILQDILSTNPAYKGRAAACSAMLGLAADPKEDDGVRDLIHDLFLNVWLENGEERLENGSQSPVSPSSAILDKLTSPGSVVEEAEERRMNEDGAGIVTPTPRQDIVTPASKSTRSHTKQLRTKTLRVRSEIAAEQMVEVVKAAKSSDNLTTLFRELLAGVSDTDKDRKASERLKRQQIAQDHCQMLVDALFEHLLFVEDRRKELGDKVGEELVATIQTIGVFAYVAPPVVLPHLDTLLPYLKGDNDVSMVDESVIVMSSCDTLYRLTAVFDDQAIRKVSEGSLADDLVKIAYSYGMVVLGSAARALCSLAHHPSVDEGSPFRRKLMKLANKCFNVLARTQDEDDIGALEVKSRSHVWRALTILGSICRYHGNIMETSDGGDENGTVQTSTMVSWGNLPVRCQQMFMRYLSNKDPKTKCSSLRALCGVFLACPRQMLEMDREGLVGNVMSADSHPSLQIEALKCWCEILVTEEARVESGEARAKMESKANITVSKRIEGDQDGDSTLFGGVLTSHADRIFEMTQCADQSIRFASLELVGHLLRQGQLNPNDAVPFLLALQGDVNADHIRSLALKLLMTEGEKRPDMLRQRVCAGVKQAYSFQSTVYPGNDEPSALLSVTVNGKLQVQCVFGPVFKECVMSVKKQRQGLYANLLGLFDMESRRGEADGDRVNDATKQAMLASIDLPLLAFASQVLAHLPYGVASDPLFIIYQISTNLALEGPDLLDRLSAFLFKYGLSSNDELDESNAEEDILEGAAKLEVPHLAKELTVMKNRKFDMLQFVDLCCEAAAITLLLRLKAFLRSVYNLSESRCLAFTPQEKSADRIPLKASWMSPFDSSLPLNAYPKDVRDADLDALILQYSEFRKRMREDVASAETRLVDSDDEDEVIPPTSTSKRKRAEAEIDSE